MESVINEAQHLKITERADIILKDLNLSWEEVEGKKVLDIGSGDSALAMASVLNGSHAKISSIDINMHDEWLKFPWQDAPKPVLADSQNLPFANGYFDKVIMHAAGGVQELPEAARVLAPGGEIRVFPIGAGGVIETWTVSYYLDTVKNMPREKITSFLEDYYIFMDENEGFVPEWYKTVRKEAFDNLSQEDKINMIDLYVERASEMSGLNLSYEIKDPDAYEPQGILIYKAV